VERSKHFWNEFGRSTPLSSSYMDITGSGSVDSMLNNYEDSESPSMEGANISSGDGAAAGAGITGAGSGVA